MLDPYLSEKDIEEIRLIFEQLRSYKAIQMDRQKIKKLIPPVFRPYLGKLGRLVDDYYPSQACTLRTLKKLGYKPKYVIDVGAYIGDWAKEYRAIFPEATVLMVEPQECNRGLLASMEKEEPDKYSYTCQLLGATDGEKVNFNIMKSGSSVFEEKSLAPREVAELSLQRLDTVLKEERLSKFSKPDFIKIDTQGYELQVLEGAGEVLNEADFVLMEVSFIQVNTSCPLFPEVIRYMEGKGFVPQDFCSQIRRKDGVLWQTDILFRNINGKFKITEELNKENWW